MLFLLITIIVMILFSLVASLHAQYFEQDESTDDEYQPLPEDWRKVSIVIGF